MNRGSPGRGSGAPGRTGARCPGRSLLDSESPGTLGCRRLNGPWRSEEPVSYSRRGSCRLRRPDRAGGVGGRQDFSLTRQPTRGSGLGARRGPAQRRGRDCCPCSPPSGPWVTSPGQSPRMTLRSPVPSAPPGILCPVTTAGSIYVWGFRGPEDALAINLKESKIRFITLFYNHCKSTFP